jgi:hypothetical protein
MKNLLLLLLLCAFALPVSAQMSVKPKLWIECGEAGEWKYGYDANRIDNDSWYSKFWMLGENQRTGQQVQFQVEVQKHQNKYRTIDGDQVSLSSSSYADIPPGSVLEAAYQAVKDIRRR